MDIGKVNNVKSALIFGASVLAIIYVYRNVLQPKVPQLPAV